ncbi:MAG: type II toxin-antitoxin system RelE/ParE family toxin [Hahellaceae bacterium]|jgi:toxin ParE1/3/4|nr:type II toxin-antitoxin system RelE/ParE family toxin [Hahellaceae bacterium]
MGQYRLSNEAKMDLARIYWRGREEYTEEQADKYYHAFFQRFEEIAETPFKYQAVDHIKEGYRRSVCGVDNIYYRVIGGDIEIMRVLGRQDAGGRL